MESVQSRHFFKQSVSQLVFVHALETEHLHYQTNSFKNALTQARELAIDLPGGEMLIEEQDHVIDMLERLRNRKRFVPLNLRSL
jgi:hypothetical protein